MDNHDLVERIINEVMKRLGNPRNKALAIFTGGTAGYDQAVDQVLKMKAEGWEITVLLTTGAELVFSESNLSSRLSGIEILQESGLRDVTALLNDKKCILIPILTMNTAAKIALGIADTPVTHLISDALLGGIPVAAATDACNPRSRMKPNASKGTEAYAKALENHLKELERYGIRMVPCGELYKTAAAWLKEEAPPGSKGPKRILTKEDVVQLKNSGNTCLVLETGMKITPYAAEAAKELGVEIICTSQMS